MTTHDPDGAPVPNFDPGPLRETVEDWCLLAAALKGLVRSQLEPDTILEVVDEALTLALASADTLEMAKATAFVGDHTPPE